MHDSNYQHFRYFRAYIHIERPFPLGQYLSTQALILRRPSGWHFLIQGQDVRHWTEWCDRMRIDLSVALRVVIPDVRKLCGALESVVIPVAMPHPTANRQFKASA